MATAAEHTHEASNVVARLRPSKARGGADHGWLKTFHTFSFSDYFDPAFDSWGCLRVINEDRIAPGSGFPTHPHGRFEIWSYILDGALGHKDSMGNIESLKPGDLQLTYAGTGIRHSEYNDLPDTETHFLQIWAMPPLHKQTNAPRYYTRHFPRSSKLNALCTILEPSTTSSSSSSSSSDREASGRPAPLESPVAMYAAVLQEGKSVSHTFVRGKGYLHVAMTSGYETPPETAARVSVAGIEVGEGDGAFLEGVKGQTVRVEGVNGEAEFVLFDLD